jgi:diaminopimelate decarboxylase
MSNPGSFFLYDLDALADWASSIRSAMPANVELFYACKANPLSGVIATLSALGFGFDVASTGELRQVLKHSSGTRLLCTGPGKTEAFFSAALANGVRSFVVESAGQLECLETCAAELGLNPRALLRLQLAWDGGSSVLGGSAVSVFGLEPEAWCEALNKVKLQNVRVEGVHVFQWGNECSPDRLEEIWVRTAGSALAFAKKAGFPLSILDLGGGIGLPYENFSGPGSILPPEVIRELIAKTQKIVPGVRLWMELGRYLVGPCGTYSTLVVDRKTVRGQEFLVTEGGAHHLLRPALVGQPFPARLKRESKASLREFRIHGPLCTALDRFGAYQLPEDVRPGDRIEFALAGAYGFTESMPYFLCHEGAAEIVRENGETRVLREAQSPESWLR